MRDTLSKNDSRHGTISGFNNYGCRCEACTEAKRQYRLKTAAKKAAARKPLAPDDPRHGTLNGYANLGCRCELCKEAQKEYDRNRRDKPIVRRDGRSVLPEDDHRHGTSNGYRRGCRCDACKEANTKKVRRYRNETDSKGGEEIRREMINRINNLDTTRVPEIYRLRVIAEIIKE